MQEQEFGERAYATFPRRLLALVMDGFVLLLVFIVGAFVAGAIGYQPLSLAFLVGFVLLIITYEPFLVSRRAGTVGHYMCNLRVVSEDSDSRLSLPRAFLRAIVKAVLGLFSFSAMTLTRRHQALHDQVTHSVVVIHDFSRAKPTHYMFERPAAELQSTVSKKRRAAVILCYCLLILIVFMPISAISASHECLQLNQCSPVENAKLEIIGVLLILVLGLVVVFGWKGKLPGARERSVSPGSEMNSA